MHKRTLLRIIETARTNGFVTRGEVYAIGDTSKSKAVVDRVLFEEWPKGLARLLVEFSVGQTKRFYLTDLGEAFDPENPPEPGVKARWTEPPEARENRLIRARQERNREKWLRARERNKPIGADSSEYKVAVSDAAETYEELNGDLRSLPVAERIALLRSRVGVNQAD
jgi:hypothetical protein